jgi:hypothetical protein
MEWNGMAHTQESARKTLREIGSVIKNPEILAISDVLLDALADPNKKTAKCLTTLLDTNFVHFIGASVSLSVAHEGEWGLCYEPLFCILEDHARGS